MSHSKYAARMAKLSGRIFGEYKIPPVPKEIIKEVHNDPAPRHKWHALHINNKKNIHLIARLPHDIDPFFVKYYPPHPQIRKLMYTLREYGLYRDEHLDFKEEMKRIAALKGKTGRTVGGSGGKRAKLQGKK